MKQKYHLNCGCRDIGALCAAIVTFGILAAPQDGSAQTVSLSDGNSSVGINLGTSEGMNNWTVDGGNHLNQQWFWYRVGNTVAAPINSIGGLTYATGANSLSATYAGASYSLTVDYTLSGGLNGSGTSQILESIKVNNFSGSTLDFHLFQYSDFNLGGTAGGDSVSVFNNGSSGYDYVSQTEGLTEIGETITLPAAQRAEAALYDATLVSLGTVSGYNLNNILEAGPGDVTWSLQWDQSIPNGGSLDVFKNKGLYVTPIPEPSIAGLIALGASLACLARRRS